MKIITRCLLGMVVVAAPLGCANQHSVYREYDATSASPRSVVLDVKERVVMVKNTALGNKACAEPPPDALSVVGTSFSGSATDKTGAALQAAAGNSESGSFVGLRTTAIQLLQYEMFRNCESEFNGDLNAQDVADLHRRDQNVMTGLLAIEQLTGAVSTRPVVLHQNADAATGGDTSKEEDRLTEKQRSLADENAKLAELQGDLDAKNKTVIGDTQDVSAATQALKIATADEKSAKQSDLDSKNAKRTSDIADAKSAQVAFNRQKAIVDAAQYAAKNAQNALTSAQYRVHASTSGSGNIADAVDSNKLDAASVQAVASAVKDIVHDIVATSFSEESCLQYYKSVSEGTNQAVDGVQAFCQALLAEKKETFLAKAEQSKQNKLQLSLQNIQLGDRLKALQAIK